MNGSAGCAPRAASRWPRVSPLPLILPVLTALACSGTGGGADAAADSLFQAVQRRGAMVMGVDQDASHHVFETLPDGGRILFQMNDTTDLAGTETIRRHLRTIADSFAAGVFTDPALVHAREVPGTATLRRLRERVAYRYSDRPGGGELRLQTADPEAAAAIGEFLAFQRSDHRAPGHAGGEH